MNCKYAEPDSSTIARYLSHMEASDLTNGDLLKEIFPDLNYRNQDNQSILHILVDNKYNERKCVLAIKALLYCGLNPNLQDDDGRNFIQAALSIGYSEAFILNIIAESLKYDLDVNQVDKYGDTIMYTAIYAYHYRGGIESIYDLLCSNGYDSTKIGRNGKDLLSALEEVPLKRYFYETQFESLKKKFYKRCNALLQKENAMVTPTLLDDEIEYLEHYGKILNYKDYAFQPTIGREEELKNLMITLAEDKKSPLIVGNPGVGKTAIVDELAYRIKRGQVPIFLQNKIILEVNLTDLVAGCEYVEFEDNVVDLIDRCKKLDADADVDVIVFIDDIHKMFSIGSAKGMDNNVASILKDYIDRSSLKVIGTTTEKEYQELISNDDLKRIFEKIIIKEPTENVLYQIIDRVIEDYSRKNGLFFQNENEKSDIVHILVDSTLENGGTSDDMIDKANNPDFAISIIDKAFAFAKVYDSEFITPEHFIEGLECCDGIVEYARCQAIASLRNLNTSISSPVKRVLNKDRSKFEK